jgi:hypothetical protein
VSVDDDADAPKEKRDRRLPAGASSPNMRDDARGGDQRRFFLGEDPDQMTGST